MIRFAFAVGLGIIILWLWDAMRVNMGASSFWQLGQAYYTPTQITAFADYPRRIGELWATVQYLFGQGIITTFFLIVAAINTIRRRNDLGLLFLAWLLGFLILHIALTLNLFDRNLLLLLPVASVLVGRAFSTPSASTNISQKIPIYQFRAQCLAPLQSPRHFFVFVIQGGGVLICAVFGFIAATGAYNIGGDDGRHDGIDDVANYLNSKPIATVIYDRWLDWELDYYMGEWTNKRRVYYPTAQQLVNGARQLEESGTRYFVVPTIQNVSDWLNALSSSGFEITIDYESYHFRIYALQLP
ncbi:MAG: hypothetical protein Q9P01_17105 [Anaerolineae bacterium]|nr:hypothetical protein [Anaerolineae bacterium]